MNELRLHYKAGGGMYSGRLKYNKKNTPYKKQKESELPNQKRRKEIVLSSHKQKGK
jgi:hypothetical protein